MPVRGTLAGVQLATVTDRYAPDEIEHYYDVGAWRRESLATLVAARAVSGPERVFLHDDTTSLTFGRLDRDAAALAAALQERGVRPGDRVGAQLPNWVEFATVVVATARLGAVVVPMMPFYRRSEVSYVLDHAQVSVCFISPRVKGSDQLALYRSLRSELPHLRDLVVVRDEGLAAPDELTYDGLLAAGARRPHQGDGAGPDEPFLVIYSSGTTAQPKGCLHTVNTLGSSARAIGTAIHLGETDTTFNPSPIVNAQGLINGLMMPLAFGSTANLVDGFQPSTALASVHRHASTVAMTPPTMLQMMLDAPDFMPDLVASTRIWMLSGAPVPTTLLERAAVVMPRARLLSAYGRSENITTSICLPEDPPTKTLTTDGRPVPHVVVKVVDPAGNEVPRGEEGDLAYRGPSHMLEYVRDPEETAKLLTADGWSRSGDLGWMDEDGYLRVSGRIKDIIIRGGLNISVRQIEDLLLEHPAIARVAVVGMPDERLGERICCWVELAAPGDHLTLEEIVSFLRAKELAVQKLPERLEILERMPENAGGKIQKKQLRELAAALDRT